MAISVQNAVEVPLGTPALVEAAKALVKRHLIADVSRLVIDNAEAVPSFSRFARHTGFINPGNRLGLLDLQPNASATLEGTTMTFYVWGVEGGNGEEIVADWEKALLTLTFNFKREDWGRIALLDQRADDETWAMFGHSVVEWLRRRWDAAIGQGLLEQLISLDTRERALRDWMAGSWTVEFVGQVLGQVSSEHRVVDDEEQLPDHCSSLYHQAEQVYAVTAELAEKLALQGEVAGTADGLPLWSLGTLDAPHLQPALQALAFAELSEASTHKLSQ